MTVHMQGNYRPPDLSIHEFNIVLEGILTTMPRSAHVYLTGDLNIDLLDPDPLMEEYCSILESVSCLPVITEPTRVIDHSKTLFDHI